MSIIHHSMLVIFIISFIINGANACKVACGPNTRTNFFTENWGSKPLDYFWVNVPYSNLCEMINSTALRKEFPALFADGRQVEHIIEKSNDYPELGKCADGNRSIRGNLAAANASWNRQVGNLCCKYTDEE